MSHELLMFPQKEPNLYSQNTKESEFGLNPLSIS